MYCSQCGKETPDSSRFCRNCGAALSGSAVVPSPGKAEAAPPPANRAAPRAKLRRKGPLVLILCILALVLAGAIAAVLLTMKGGYGKKYQYRTDSVSLIESVYGLWMADDLVVYHADGTPIAFGQEFATDNASAYYKSGDRSHALVAGESCLGYVGEDEIEPLPSGSYESLMGLSYDGTAVLYESIDPYDSARVLNFIHDGKTQSPSRYPLSGQRTADVCLSPSGSVALFSLTDEDTWGDYSTFETYMWENGKEPVRMDDWALGVEAVTDDGEIFYYTGADNNGLYVRTSDGETCLHVTANLYFTHYYTADNRQILYNDDTGCHICVNGKDIYPVSSVTCSVLLPDRAQSMQYATDSTDIYLGLDSYAGSFVKEYSSDSWGKYNILFVDRDYNVHRILEDVDYSVLAEDGKTIVFMKDGLLYQIDGTKTDARPTAISNAGVYQFAVTPDGKTVFYALQDGQLFMTDGKDTTKLADYTFIMNADYQGNASMTGDTLYYITDGVLYSIKKGEEPRPCSAAFEGDIDSVSCDGIAVDVYTIDETETNRMYRLTSDGDFKCIHQWYSTYYW